MVTFELPESCASSPEDPIVFEDFIPEDPQGRRLVQMIAVGQSGFISLYRKQASHSPSSTFPSARADEVPCREWMMSTCSRRPAPVSSKSARKSLANYQSRLNRASHFSSSGLRQSVGFPFIRNTTYPLWRTISLLRPHKELRTRNICLQKRPKSRRFAIKEMMARRSR